MLEHDEPPARAQCRSKVGKRITEVRDSVHHVERDYHVEPPKWGGLVRRACTDVEASKVCVENAGFRCPSSGGFNECGRDVGDPVGFAAPLQPSSDEPCEFAASYTDLEHTLSCVRCRLEPRHE